jgi:drug/metabolite transporter (DMT)-like permease
MIFLFTAVLFSSCIIFTFRLFSLYKVNNLQAIVINYLVAAPLSFVSFKGSFEFNELFQREWFFMAIIIGFFFIAVFFVFARSAQLAGVAITSVSSKMSVVIPVGIGIMFYGDMVNILKVLGILFSIISFYLIFKRDNFSSTDKRYILLPVLLFLGNGANDSLMKHAQKFYVGDEFMLFLGVIFSTSFVIGVILTGFYRPVFQKEFFLKNAIFGILLGLFNYASTYFFIRGLSVLESSVFFPLFNVSIVSMGALIGFLIFREQLSKINWIGIFLAILSIIMVALA